MEGEALEMVDQIFAGEGLLRHGAGRDVLKPEMAVEIHHGGHHGLAGQINASGAGGQLQFAATADLGETAVLDHEGGILDRTAAAGDQARALIDRRGRLRVRRQREGRGEDDA